MDHTYMEKLKTSSENKEYFRHQDESKIYIKQDSNIARMLQAIIPPGQAKKTNQTIPQ